MDTRALVRAAALGFVVLFALPRTARAGDKECEKPNLVGAYADVEMATTGVTLTTLGVDQAAQNVGMVRLRDRGLTVGFGGGIRLSVVTLGPRIRITPLETSRLLTVGGELGIRVPIDRLGIYLALGGGYASRGSIDSPDPASGVVPATGYYASVGGGIDVRIIYGLTLGIGVTYSLVAFTPDGVGASDLANIASDVVAIKIDQAWSDARRLAGSGYGSALGVSGNLGFRF
jgi:hypothetical protein